MTHVNVVNERTSQIISNKFEIGDKAYKPKGYEFPCTIIGIMRTTKGEVRVVAEMEGYGLLHIFSEQQLELATAKV